MLITRLVFYEIRKSVSRSLNKTGAQAASAGINSARCAVYYRSNLLNIGLVGSVASSVRVGNLNSESYFFIADITFSHGLHLLLERPKHPITIAISIITENKTKSKYYFCKIPLNFQIIKGTRTDYQLPGKYSLPDELEEPEEPDELEELEEPEELDEFEELEEPEVPEFFEELLLLLPEAALTVELPPAEELSSSVVMVISIPDKSISLY